MIKIAQNFTAETKNKAAIQFFSTSTTREKESIIAPFNLGGVFHGNTVFAVLSCSMQFLPKACFFIIQPNCPFALRIKLLYML